MARQEAPKSQRIMIFMLGLSLSGWLGQMAIGTTLQTLRDKRQQIKRVRNDLDNLSMAEMDLDEGRAILDLQVEYQHLSSLLPENMDAMALLESTMAKYEPNGPIEFERLEPQEIEMGEMHEADDGTPTYGPSQLPIRIRFLSDYTEMVRYMHFLESQNWLLSTETLHTRTHPENPSLLMTDALVTIALSPTSDTKAETHAAHKPHAHPTNPNNKTPLPTLQTLRFVPSKPTYIFSDDDSPVDPNHTNLIIENLTQVAVEPNETPLSAPDFKVDGLWQDGIVVNGEVYNVGQTIDAWTIRAVNKKNYTVLLQQKQHIIRIQVE